MMDTVLSLLLGSFLMFIIGGRVNEVTGFPYIMYFGCFGIPLAFLYGLVTTFEWEEGSFLGDVIFHKETQADRDAFEIIRKKILNDYTPAELRRMDEEENAAYVDAISAHPMRTAWLDTSGVSHYEEYVIDRRGHKHIVSSG